MQNTAFPGDQILQKYMKQSCHLLLEYEPVDLMSSHFWAYILGVTICLLPMYYLAKKIKPSKYMFSLQKCFCKLIYENTLVFYTDN